jgi:hypothetical protein
MARIIKRSISESSERDPNFRPSGSNTDGISIAPGSDSSPRTGEPDNDVGRDTSNERTSGSGIDGDGEGFTDPATGTRSGGSNDGSPTRRRRGRGPARGSKPSRATTTQTTGDIAAILYSLHFGMANIFKSELIAITKDESETLSAAITRVTELYEIRILPEKQMAWLNLIIVAGSIYGPRVAASSLKKKAKKGPQTIESINRITEVPNAEVHA